MQFANHLHLFVNNIFDPVSEMAFGEALSKNNQDAKSYSVSNKWQLLDEIFVDSPHTAFTMSGTEWCVRTVCLGKEMTCWPRQRQWVQYRQQREAKSQHSPHVHFSGCRLSWLRMRMFVRKKRNEQTLSTLFSNIFRNSSGREMTLMLHKQFILKYDIFTMKSFPE